MYILKYIFSQYMISQPLTRNSVLMYFFNFLSHAHKNHNIPTALCYNKLSIYLGNLLLLEHISLIVLTVNINILYKLIYKYSLIYKYVNCFHFWYYHFSNVKINILLVYIWMYIWRINFYYCKKQTILYFNCCKQLVTNQFPQY